MFSAVCLFPNTAELPTSAAVGFFLDPSCDGMSLAVLEKGAFQYLLGER